VPFFAGGEMLASQVAAVWNPLFILILIPVFSIFIYPMTGKILDLTPLRKMSIGFWVMAFAFCIVTVIQYFVDSEISLSVGWQILACFFLTASEVLISVTCLEFAYTQAPRRMKSLVMGFFLLTVSFGNFLTSQVKFLLIQEDGTSVMNEIQEFCFWTVLIVVTAIAFIFVSRSYKIVEHLHES
jgi:POT family proton-dependent oligopeptide transporter